MQKERIFKNGDVIVSGYGNIRIFTDVCFGGDNYACLTPYSTSDAPAGTDMRFARHANEDEKELFFKKLKGNDLEYDENTNTITAGSLYDPQFTENARVVMYKGLPMPYMVKGKRKRATLGEIRELKKEIEELKEELRLLNMENRYLKEEVEYSNKGFFERLFGKRKKKEE